jgi:hypothetical protein
MAFMLSVASKLYMLSVPSKHYKLSVVILNVVMLSVVMLNVVDSLLFAVLGLLNVDKFQPTECNLVSVS